VRTFLPSIARLLAFPCALVSGATGRSPSGRQAHSRAAPRAGIGLGAAQAFERFGARVLVSISIVPLAGRLARAPADRQSALNVTDEAPCDACVGDGEYLWDRCIFNSAASPIRSSPHSRSTSRGLAAYGRRAFCVAASASGGPPGA